jgi:hypothetical protein
MMSAHERQALVSLVTALLLAVAFWVFALPKYPAEDPYSAAVFHFWGVVAVISIPVSIAVNIAISIGANVVYTIATHEATSSFADERDRLIELRTLRIALYVFTTGFFLAMGSLALGATPSVMFIILMCAGYGSWLVGNIAKLYLYRKGS